MFDGVNDIIFIQPDRVVIPLNWVEHIPFAFKLVEVVKPRLIVELGVHSGNSFCAFNQAVKILNLSTICYGIDTWNGDSQAGFYDSTVFENLSKYVKEHYQESAELMKCTFDEALDAFEDHSIDILHIDGLHDYDSVYSDFQKWKRKLSNFSVVLFHDTQVTHHEYGVHKLWSEINEKYMSFEFQNSHGLGVLLYGGNQNLDTINYLEYLKNSQKYTNLLKLIGSQIYFSNNCISLENNLNSTKEILKRYSTSRSFKIGNLILKPFRLFC